MKSNLNLILKNILDPCKLYLDWSDSSKMPSNVKATLNDSGRELDSNPLGFKVMLEY